MKCTPLTTALLLIGALSLAPIDACAQDAPTEPEKDTTEKKETEKTVDTPSLDELLGLPGIDEPGETETNNEQTDEQAPETERDITKKRLDEALDSAEEITDEFKLALKEMDESADRLELSLDTGAATQRLQQSVIRRLADLIEASQQQQSSSSSSSSQQSSQQQQQPNQPNQSNQQSSANNPSGENTGERLPPGGPDSGELNKAIDAKGAAWGSLPERVREALQQGSEDYYSRLYDSMTESYYKRLAEEGTDQQ